MVTNGLFLDDDRARRIVDAGMGSISISMDGPVELNDRLRGRGVSAKVEEAIAALRAAWFGGELEIISTYDRCHGGSMHLYSSPDDNLARCLYPMAKSTE
jgi:sulfatase maturation enzyme AslB (radical SAM superfamily)